MSARKLEYMEYLERRNNLQWVTNKSYHSWRVHPIVRTCLGNPLHGYLSHSWLRSSSAVIYKTNINFRVTKFKCIRFKINKYFTSMLHVQSKKRGGVESIKLVESRPRKVRGRVCVIGVSIWPLFLFDFRIVPILFFVHFFS